jgi:hypothetical protein
LTFLTDLCHIDYAYYQSQAEQPASQNANEQQKTTVTPAAFFVPSYQGHQQLPQGFSPGFAPGALQQQQQQFYRSFTPNIQPHQQQYVAAKR